MPMYEYKCKKCEVVFSELRQISERTNPISCPECNGKAEVILSAFSQGKGSEPSCGGGPAGPGPGCPSAGYG
jgi:putative FmdB family regulatory protein